MKESEPFESSSVKMFLRSLEFCVSRTEEDVEVVKSARLGFSYTNHCKKDYELDELARFVADQEENQEDAQRFRKAVQPNYFLSVIYPDDFPMRTGACLPIHFRGSEEALETALRKEVEGLKQKEYPNIYFCLPLEFDVMKIVHTERV
jgi:hypothetical protein